MSLFIAIRNFIYAFLGESHLLLVGILAQGNLNSSNMQQRLHQDLCSPQELDLLVWYFYVMISVNLMLLQKLTQWLFSCEKVPIIGYISRLLSYCQKPK